MMNTNLQENLFEKHPLVFADKGSIEPRSPFSQRGIECGNGWFKLLDNLCASLTDKIKVWQQKNPNIKNKHPRVAQVKEKLGGLRFYMTYPGGNEQILVMEFSEFISAFEKESYKICEQCGNDATLNLVKNMTLCETCYNKRKSR